MNAAAAPIEDGTFDRLVSEAPRLSDALRARLAALLAPAEGAKR